MNKHDYIIHIHTENDTLLNRLERASNECAIEDVNRVRRIILASMAIFTAVFGILATVVACL